MTDRSTHTLFATLEPVECLYDFDGPKLFTVRGSDGGLNLACWSDRAGAGMRRHVHSGNHAAESFVSFIPLFDGAPRCAVEPGEA